MESKVNNFDVKRAVGRFLAITPSILTIPIVFMGLFLDSSYLIIGLITAAMATVFITLCKNDTEFKYSKYIVPVLVSLTPLSPQDSMDAATSCMMFMLTTLASLQISSIYEDNKSTIVSGCTSLALYTVGLILYKAFGVSIINEKLLNLPLLDTSLLFILIIILTILNLFLSTNNTQQKLNFKEEANKARVISELANDTVARLESVKGKILETVSEINKDSSNLNSRSGEINEIFTNITEGIVNQNDDLQDITSNFYSFNSLIEKNSEFIESINLQIKSIHTYIQENKKEMDMLQQQTVETETANNELLKAISNILEQSQKIVDFVRLIDSIASQTNLLALNASIESSKSGEAGRGFAVVTREIKKLADSTKDYSNQIKSVMDSIVLNIEHTNKLASNNTTNLDKTKDIILNVVPKFDLMIENLDNTSKETDKLNRENILLGEKSKDIFTKIESISSISEDVTSSSQEAIASLEIQKESISEINNKLKALNTSV